MSNLEKKEAAADPQPMDLEYAGPVPPRKGKRRNCMVVPGSSNPIIAKMYSQALMKDLFGAKKELDQ